LNKVFKLRKQLINNVDVDAILVSATDTHVYVYSLKDNLLLLGTVGCSKKYSTVDFIETDLTLVLSDGLSGDYLSIRSM
jgi:hypothetical protein